MTVEELLEALQKQDPINEVRIRYCDQDCGGVEMIVRPISVVWDVEEDVVRIDVE